MLFGENGYKPSPRKRDAGPHASSIACPPEHGCIFVGFAEKRSPPPALGIIDYVVSSLAT
jgi:hypothetical protein